MKTTQQKWGNSLVIRVPKRAGCAAASAASLSTGRPVEMYQAPPCPGGSRFS